MKYMMILGGLMGGIVSIGMLIKFWVGPEDLFAHALILGFIPIAAISLSLIGVGISEVVRRSK